MYRAGPSKKNHQHSIPMLVCGSSSQIKFVQNLHCKKPHSQVGQLGPRMSTATTRHGLTGRLKLFSQLFETEIILFRVSSNRMVSAQEISCPVTALIGTYPNLSTAEGLLTAMRARRRFGPNTSRICGKGTGFTGQRASICRMIRSALVSRGVQFRTDC
jgi:hypothetical protein